MKMSTVKVVTMKHDIILGQQPLVVEVSVPTSEIPHPNGDQKTRNTQNVTHKTPMNRLFRQGNKNKTSRKHNKIVTEFEREPQAATYTFIAQETRKKRMRPMTSKDRHDANRTLRSCVAILNSTTVRKILNIEFPDKFYGHVSTVVNPLEDMLSLQIPTAEMPLQYGSKRKPAQYTHHKTFILRGRRKKTVMQNFNKTESFLPIDLCYELYGTVEQLCDTPIIDHMNRMDEVRSADAAHVSEEELKQARQQALQQRFDDCVHSLYYSKTRKKQK